MTNAPASADEPAKIRLRGLTAAVVAMVLAAAVAGEPACAASGANLLERYASDGATARGDVLQTAAWPFFKPQRRPLFESTPATVTPHPAVARVIVPEKGATAFGSGTLVDVRDQYGLVVTNWHVVRDSEGVVEVVFPGGFRSQARPLKVDSDWDLAALVIWRPPIEPITLAAQAPRPGDLLTIHGYGQGQYRIATGRCTNYYAPRQNFPTEMVELDVEARQGDSGGPIFNQQGELAGVLFGAGQGTTLGSFGPRVGTFLATLAPDIGQARQQLQVAVADRPAPDVRAASLEREIHDSPWPSSAWQPAGANSGAHSGGAIGGPGYGTGANFDGDLGRSGFVAAGSQGAGAAGARAELAEPAGGVPLGWDDVTGSGWYEPLKSLLAMIGLATIALQLVKAVR